MSIHATSELRLQTIEPHRLKQLPWPRNLFGELATIEELMAEAAQPPDQAGENAGDASQCGRGRQNVSQTLSDPYGFRIIWFWSDARKNRWNQARTRRQANGT